MTAIPTIVLALLFIPWTIRNEVRMHAFIPTSTNTGDTLCLDRNSTAEGGFRFADHDGCVDPGLPEVPRNNGNTRKAIDFVLHNPGKEAEEIVKRGHLIFNGDHDGVLGVSTLHGRPTLYSPMYNFFSSLADWYFYGVLVCALAGIPLLFRGPHGPERRIL